MARGGGVEQAPREGLVSSAVSGADEVVVPDHRSLLRFPSADLIGAAAGLFPVSYGGNGVQYGRLLRPQVWTEYVSASEGPLPFLEVGPGMVRFGRSDQARSDRSRDRAIVAELSRRAVAAAYDIRLETEPMALRPGTSDRPALAGVVNGWSAKSRQGLIRRIASLDLEPLVTAEEPPAMITLTLPGPWQQVAPDAAAAADLLNTWRAVFERRWKVKLRCIWKREFQRRGAPHWHLWLVIPTSNRKAFREWLSSSWVSVCKTAERCGPEHARRHLAAGTGLDFAEGLRARDPKRLALYFLKESLGGEGKAYQNRPPAAWEGQSVGRYWGVRGIPLAVERIALDPAWGHRLWRAMRRYRERSAGVRVVLVPRGANQAGEVRYRRVRRRVKVPAGAGWVTVNDGAAFAAHLARLADLLAAEHDEVVRQAEEAARVSDVWGSLAPVDGLPGDDPAADEEAERVLTAEQRRLVVMAGGRLPSA